jgi:hypothetical protein
MESWHYSSFYVPRAMGFLISAASIAEMDLAHEILRIVGSAPSRSMFHAYPLVVGVDAKVKVSLLRIFLKMFDLDKYGFLNKTLDKISTLFDRRNEIAHSVIQQIPKKKDQIKFQDLRAKIRLGSMPPSQVRTAKEISGYARELLLQCRLLEDQLTSLGIPTIAEFRITELANLELESQRARARSETPPPRPTKRRTRRERASSKDRKF